MANPDQGAVGGEAGQSPEVPFDFERHRRLAVDQYTGVRELYRDCAHAVRGVLDVALQVEQIRVNSVEARGKSVASFGEKAEAQRDGSANQPKYPDPLNEITDLAGVRVITFLPDHVDAVGTLVEREFEVRERVTIQQASGYRGLHLLVTFAADRFGLPEYRRYKDRIAEVQIRTVLQHAWAEIEHGVAYKAAAPVSDSVRTKLRDVAGALTMAENELQRVVSQAEREQLSGGD
jgi:putative GTP pyrophosphokinase